MNKAEFDKFADEYIALHVNNIRASGESPEFFAEYKIQDTARMVGNTTIQSDAKILDFGAGIGNSVPFFAKYFPKSQLTCIDVSERSMGIAAERFPGLADYKIFDGVHLPFEDGTFDIVFTACVFHHIPEELHKSLFKEILRVLNSGGALVVFEHNPHNPLTRRAVDSCPFDENAVLINAATLAGRVSTAGFKNVRSKYRIFFPRSLKFFRFIERYLGWIPLGAQYYVVGTKN